MYEVVDRGGNVVDVILSKIEMEVDGRFGVDGVKVDGCWGVSQRRAGEVL